MEINIILDWPDKKLSPNKRLCWQAKIKPKQNAFDNAFQATIKSKSNISRTDKLSMTIIFFKPDNIRRDIDNLLSSLKPSIDGIFKALKCDDSQIKEYKLLWGDKVKGGAVLISINEFVDTTSYSIDWLLKNPGSG